MPEKVTLIAAKHAYVYTKNLILRGELPGGQLVSEGQICGDLGLSRTPVHEAFLRLESERLLTLSPRKGAVVLPMSPHEIKDVLEMREAVESSAARRSIEEGTLDAAAIRGLRSTLDRQRSYRDCGDVAAFVESDDELHSAVVAASGNAMAVHFFALLRDRQQRLRYQLLSIRPEQLQHAHEDHIQLVACLEAADSEGYCEALRAHVARHRGVL